MLCRAAPGTDLASRRGSLTSCGLFASSTIPLGLTQDIPTPLANKATAKESLRPFDWSNWEDWVQWDRDNGHDVSHTVTATTNSIPYLNLLPAVTSDDNGVSNIQKSIGTKLSPGLASGSTNNTGQIFFKDRPVEQWPNDSLFEFDNITRFSGAPAKLSTNEFLDLNLLPLQQLRFSRIADAGSGNSPEQRDCQRFDLQSSNLSEQSLSPADSSHRSIPVSPLEGSFSGNSKKRKSLADDENTELTPTEPRREQDRKRAHKMVEKKYRMNLNEKIAVLRDSIPSLQMRKNSDSSNENGDDEDIDGELKPTTKPNKGEVLSKATEYIRYLEKRNRKLSGEVVDLRRRLNAFKTFAMTGPIGLNGGMVQDEEGVLGLYGNEIQQQFQTDTQPDPRIEAQSKIQNNCSSHESSPISPQGDSAGHMSKLILGSLVGFMIIQGFNEQEQAEGAPSDRGLFSLPTQHMGSLKYFLHYLHQPSVIRYVPLLEKPVFLLKVAIMIAIILYAILPLFLDTRPGENAKPAPDSLPVLSLASPVEVRRSAWLTAIQTVWVPRQSFLLQAVALMLKSCKFLLRNTIGPHRYAALTGTTEEQEGARVKAWEIAIDSQLAGGDADISIGRLVLTMIASGTLPESPYRLMLKAFHIHVLFWEASKRKIWGWYFYRMFAAKLARSYWKKARKLQMQSNGLLTTNEASKCDALPDYLARLLDLDSDVVMVDAVVQRAHNLVWNKPNSHRVSECIDDLNRVVDDPAIHSPLDALAAWYSSLVLQRVLTRSLEGTMDQADLEVEIRNELETALKVAPTASLVQNRCLVAYALLLSKGRRANISAALQALMSSSQFTLTCVETTFPSLTTCVIPADLDLSLRCAMAIALLDHPQNSKAVVDFARQTKFPSNSLNILELSAVYNFLDAMFQNKEVAYEAKDVLEKVAVILKTWIRGEQGKNSVLGKEAKVNISRLCLTVFRWLVEEG